MATATLKIKNHSDLDIEYAVMDASRVIPSHLPCECFRRAPSYPYENERRYHDNSRDQEKVLAMARSLDAAFLLECPTCSDGAPIVDLNGYVLGGNGRTMAIQAAYGNDYTTALNYEKAVRDYAIDHGIDTANIDNPILVRRIVTPLTKAEGQALISLLNQGFGDSKEKRADAYSRGSRFSAKTLNALARALGEADSLRAYFDDASSLPLVNMLVSDGVIMDSEANMFINAGFLNPDGKALVESALRSIIAPNLDAIARMPAPILGKIDAAIPHILIASQVAAAWDIRKQMTDSVALYSEYRAQKDTFNNFLLQGDMFKAAAGDRYSKAAIAFCRYLIEDSKSDYVKRFAGFAGQAKISIEAGGLGVGMPFDKAYVKYFGIEYTANAQNQEAKEVENKETEKAAEVVENPAPETAREEKPRKASRASKNDCDKHNSMLVKSITCQDLEKAQAFFEKEYFGKGIELTANSKTQFRVDGHEGFRVIKTGRQWQLRLLNGYVEAIEENIDIEDNTEIQAEQAQEASDTIVVAVNQMAAEADADPIAHPEWLAPMEYKASDLPRGSLAHNIRIEGEKRRHIDAFPGVLWIRDPNYSGNMRHIRIIGEITPEIVELALRNTSQQYSYDRKSRKYAFYSVGILAYLLRKKFVRLEKVVHYADSYQVNILDAGYSYLKMRKEQNLADQEALADITDGIILNMQTQGWRLKNHNFLKKDMKGGHKGVVNPEGKRIFTILVKNGEAILQFGWDNPIRMTYDSRTDYVDFALCLHNRIIRFAKETGEYADQDTLDGILDADAVYVGKIADWIASQDYGTSNPWGRVENGIVYQPNLYQWYNTIFNPSDRIWYIHGSDMEEMPLLEYKGKDWNDWCEFAVTLRDCIKSYITRWFERPFTVDKEKRYAQNLPSEPTRKHKREIKPGYPDAPMPIVNSISKRRQPREETLKAYVVKNVPVRKTHKLFHHSAGWCPGYKPPSRGDHKDQFRLI